MVDLEQSIPPPGRSPTKVAFSSSPLSVDSSNRPPTWTDVAMKLVSDLPAISVIGLVGVLALKGQANAMEMVMTGFGVFLSRSWPKPIQVGSALVFVAAIGAIQAVSACTPLEKQAAIATSAAAETVCIALDAGATPTCVAVNEIAPFLPIILARRVDGGYSGK